MPVLHPDIQSRVKNQGFHERAHTQMHIIHQCFIIDNFSIDHRGRNSDFYYTKILDRSFTDTYSGLPSRLQNDPGRSCTWHTRAHGQWWSLPMARRYFIISFEAHAYKSACTQGAPARSPHHGVPRCCAHTSPIKCRINSGTHRILGSRAGGGGGRMNSAENLLSKRG